jgi:hypothetical protein
MRQRFLAVLLLAATTLPSCSEEPNAFIDKSPKEIASYLVFGLKDGSELVTANETMTAHVATASRSPSLGMRCAAPTRWSSCA